MKLILKSDVEGVGHRGDIVDVADGYGRNYLVPKGMAMLATKGAETQAAVMRRGRDLKDAEDRDATDAVAKTLVAATITISAKASPEGKLFGSVTAADIADAVKDQTGAGIDRRQLQLDEHIKDVGTHQVFAKLHADVAFPLTIEVVPA
ncbi:MAG TPA: 50S ribosomal protein L9 [Acidimicrobiales bacterium]|nr:50S ribosomal protein L9 [Acidimicrobiales bacterium]